MTLLPDVLHDEKVGVRVRVIIHTDTQSGERMMIWL